MIPKVLVLTGFLGAGKTTLLNRMIAARALGDGGGTLGAGGRLALIVNELGEIGIDGALLPSEMTRQVELPGGCICCALNEDLDRTVLELLDGAPDVATIVIETTGVAEPLPIAWALGREPLASRVRLTAVVTLVDPLHFPGQRSLSPSVDSQVAYADVVVLTKTDLATPAQVAAARALVAELAPRAPVIAGGPEEIVGWLAGALADPELPRPSGSAQDRPREGLIVAPLRGHGIDSVWVPTDGLVDLEELGDALAELPPDYVRVKGIVWAVDGRDGVTEPHWAAVHRVGLRVSSERLAPSGVEGPGPRCLVALGPGVQREPLAACVRRAMLSSESETAP
jgi:G3E family GTPase